LDEIFGRHPQISIFRALRLLKIKMSGGGILGFEKHLNSQKIEMMNENKNKKPLKNKQ